MSVFVLINLLFSSVPIASWKMPSGMRWLMYLSINFYAVSGSVMTHFDPDGVYDNSESCSDLLTCLATDGRMTAHFLGFAQMSNQYLSFGVLIAINAVGAALEYLCLLLRKR